MAIDPATMSSSTMGSSGISSSTEYGGESSSSSEIDKMGYILRDRTLNSVARFEGLNGLSDNLLNLQEKQIIADHLNARLGLGIRVAGVHVSTMA